MKSLSVPVTDAVLESVYLILRDTTDHEMSQWQGAPTKILKEFYRDAALAAGALESAFTTGAVGSRVTMTMGHWDRLLETLWYAQTPEGRALAMALAKSDKGLHFMLMGGDL